LDVDAGDTGANGVVVIANQDVRPESDAVGERHARFAAENDGVGE
jgi:hypothetical protein